MRPFSTTGGTTHCSHGTGEQPWRGVRRSVQSLPPDIQALPKKCFFSAYFLKKSLVCANKIAQPECYMRSQLSWKGVEQVHEKENKEEEEKEEEEEEEEEGGTVREPAWRQAPVTDQSIQDHTDSAHCTMFDVTNTQTDDNQSAP